MRQATTTTIVKDTFMTSMGEVLAERDTLLAPILEELLGHRVLTIKNAVPYGINCDAGVYTLCHIVADMENLGETAIALHWCGSRGGDVVPVSRSAHTTLMEAWNMKPYLNDRALYTIFFAPVRVGIDVPEIYRMRPDSITDPTSGRVVEFSNSEIMYVDYTSVDSDQYPAVTCLCRLMRNHACGSNYYTSLAEAVYSNMEKGEAPVGFGG